MMIDLSAKTHQKGFIHTCYIQIDQFFILFIKKKKKKET